MDKRFYPIGYKSGLQRPRQGKSGSPPRLLSSLHSMTWPRIATGAARAQAGGTPFAADERVHVYHKSPGVCMSMSGLRTLVETTVFGALAATMLLTSPVVAQNPELLLRFQPAGPTTGPFGKTLQTGDVEIWVDAHSRTTLEFTLFGLTPRGVHSVFLDLDPFQPPLSGTVPDCIATDPHTGTRAEVYCWTPAAPDTAAFASGSGLDPHGFIADERGNALFRLHLNYDIFQSQIAPLVLRPGVTQTVRVAPAGGVCAGSPDGSFITRIDSAFMRAFDTSVTASHPTTSPSFPLRDLHAAVRLVRATVRGIFVMEHLDGVTHGRVLGQGVAGPGDGPCGDHARRLRGDLTQAMPKVR
jgi:hypothetical protein